nr:uncharacterized protein LOC129276000 [Lytechinus pictus]
MLVDPKLEGLVEFGNPAEKRPKHGWDVYKAKVLVASEKKADVLKKEKEFLNTTTRVDEAMDESDITDEDMEDEASTSKKDVRKRVGKADRSAMAELLKKKKTEDQGDHEGQFKSLLFTARFCGQLNEKS